MTAPDTLARSFRQRHLLNVSLANAGKTPGLLKEACDAAEMEFVHCLRAYAAEKVTEAVVAETERCADIFKVRTTFDVPGTVYRVVLKTNERLAIAAAIRSRTKGAGL